MWLQIYLYRLQALGALVGATHSMARADERLPNDRSNERFAGE